MLGLKVQLNMAEKAKRFIIEKSIINKDYRPKKESGYIIFPIIKKITFKEGEIVETEFDDTSRKTEDYKDLLKDKLTENEFENLPSSYDILGDIIIIEVKDNLVKHEKIIADSLLKTHKAVKTILKKADIHGGEFRTQKLDYLAGENTKETIYRENNARFLLDVEKVYFSPRLSTERKRIYKQVKKGENILVMFSGCGVYSIVFEKNTNAKRILGIEKNPIAHKYALKNLELNKTNKIEFLKGDVRDIVPKLDEKFDRIAMPLPKDADTFLESILNVVKKGTIIHLYGFSHRDNIKETEEKINEFCKKHNIKHKIYKTVKCGQYSPCKYRVCVDFEIM